MLSAARERTREKVCTSNLRQIGMAFRACMEDHDAQRPYPLPRLAPSYVTSPSLLVCPSDATGNHSYVEWGYRLFPEGWRHPASYDFFGATDAQWAVMEERGPRSGYVVDRNHGENAVTIRTPSGSPVVVRWGHTLRLNMDGSVVTREIHYEGGDLCNAWTLYNFNPGEPLPPDPG